MERVKLNFPTDAVIHHHSVSVRVTDMNYGRHLGHDALVSLLHEARSQALMAVGYPEWDLAGFHSVVADLAVQYQSEARCPDVLVVETAIPDPAGKALSVYHRVLADEGARLVATARLNLLVMDSTAGNPVAVPAEVVQALAKARLC
ncbi:MAG: thioesterase [Halomonas sp.]|nr:thioesterase family protein [Halomonas sp.]TVM08154.1 MAG: thioesterase [Halomonas sp.]